MKTTMSTGVNTVRAGKETIPDFPQSVVFYLGFHPECGKGEKGWNVG